MSFWGLLNEMWKGISGIKGWSERFLRKFVESKIR